MPGKLFKKLDKSFHLLILPYVEDQEEFRDPSQLIRKAKLIRKIFQTIHDRSNNPHPMDYLTLQKLLQAFLNCAHQL